jgi:hypothetical protein
MEQLKLCDVLNESLDFESLRLKYSTSILNERIVKFLLFREDETEFFDLTPYLRDKTFNEYLDSVLISVKDEIESLGYKTSFGYGKTGLFIYKNDPPENAW